MAVTGITIPSGRVLAGLFLFYSFSLLPTRITVISDTPVPVFPLWLCPTDTFSLATSSVLAVFSGNSGEHIQHHAIYGRQHASGKLITYSAG